MIFLGPQHKTLSIASNVCQAASPKTLWIINWANFVTLFTTLSTSFPILWSCYWVCKRTCTHLNSNLLQVILLLICPLSSPPLFCLPIYDVCSKNWQAQQYCASQPKYSGKTWIEIFPDDIFPNETPDDQKRSNFFACVYCLTIWSLSVCLPVIISFLSSWF